MAELSGGSTVGGKLISTVDHLHDDRYYTEAEINSLLSGKSDVGHTHSYVPLSSTYHYVIHGDVYTKYRMWGTSSSYGIGMVSAISYGYLNDYAMTFCMNNDADRGFWWGYDGQAKSDGAMSLTTNGKLYVKDIISGHHIYDRYRGGYCVVGNSTYKITVSSTAPSSPQINDIWIEI